MFEIKEEEELLVSALIYPAGSFTKMEERFRGEKII